MDASVLWKVLCVLGRVTYILRPVKIDCASGVTEVSITDNVATVRVAAKLDYGLWQWWTRFNPVTIPLPRGLDLGMEVSGRNATADVDFKVIANHDLLAEVSDLLRNHGGRWHKADQIHFEFRANVKTLALLEFNSGRVLDDAQYVTTIAIGKRREFRDVRIRSFRWTTLLDLNRPYESIVVRKNDHEDREVLCDVLETSRVCMPIGTLCVLRADQAAPTRPADTSKTFELTIPLSFEEPDDTYQITFRQKSQ